MITPKNLEEAKKNLRLTQEIIQDAFSMKEKHHQLQRLAVSMEQALQKKDDATGKLVEALEYLADFSPHCCEDCPCDEFRRKAEEALFTYRKEIGERE